MANTDRARKLLVRSALVTSTTIATFVGAQNLAMLDTRLISLTATPFAESAAEVPALVVPTSEVMASVTSMPQAVAPTLMIQKAAPSIIVLRQSQQQAASPIVSSHSPAQGNAMVIQPPVPAQMAAPAPVIVQQQSSPQMSAPAQVVVQQPVQQPGQSSR